MRTALYIRVSTEDQAREGLSLEAQRAALTQYASAHELEVVGLYEDDGISARSSYRKRTAFTNLLEDVKQDKVDLILFIKLDRWFRNVAGYYEVQKILDEHNVKWNAIYEEYDTTTANGRLHLNIRLSIAQDEADRTSERVKFVLDRKRQRGEYVGTAAFGLMKSGGQLVQDPDTVQAVRDMFEHFISTRSMRQTQSMLKEKYGKSVTPPGMRKMLVNEHYVECGVVDKATLQTASEILLSRAQRNSATKTYIFSGIIYCAKCGGRMCAGGQRGRRPSYHCSTYNKYNACVCNHIAEYRVEELLLMRLPDAIHENNMEIVKASVDGPDIPALKQKLVKLKDLYLDDLISKDVYREEYNHITGLIETASRHRIYHDEAEMTSVMALYRDFTPEERKAFWSRVVRRVYIKPGTQTEDRIDRILFL